MNINWKVRLKNKYFWITVIPALILVIQSAAAVFGLEVDMTSIVGKIVAAVDALFALLAVLGISVDMTTAGIGDSARAQTYTVPYQEVGGENDEDI